MHGKRGISLIPLFPNLAGQKLAYLIKQLKSFKNKIRKDLIMTGISSNLSDTDIEDLAAYYESLK
jgi:cytochrome c553